MIPWNWLSITMPRQTSHPHTHRQISSAINTCEAKATSATHKIMHNWRNSTWNVPKFTICQLLWSASNYIFRHLPTSLSPSFSLTYLHILHFFPLFLTDANIKNEEHNNRYAVHFQCVFHNKFWHKFRALLRERTEFSVSTHINNSHINTHIHMYVNVCT